MVQDAVKHITCIYVNSKNQKADDFLQGCRKSLFSKPNIAALFLNWQHFVQLKFKIFSFKTEVK